MLLHRFVSESNSKYAARLNAAKIESHSPKVITIKLKILSHNAAQGPARIINVTIKPFDSVAILKLKINSALEAHIHQPLSHFKVILDNKVFDFLNVDALVCDIKVGEGATFLLSSIPANVVPSITATASTENVFRPAQKLESEPAAPATPPTAPTSPAPVADFETPHVSQDESVQFGEDEVPEDIAALPLCILSESKYFDELFHLLDSSDSVTVDLVWSFLKLLPTNSHLKRSLFTLSAFDIDAIFDLHHVHRFIYFLQLILNFLEKAHSGLEPAYSDWLKRFVASGYVANLVLILKKFDLSPNTLKQKWKVKKLLFFLNVMRSLLLTESTPRIDSGVKGEV